MLAALLLYDFYHSPSNANLLTLIRLACLMVHVVIVRQLVTVDPGIASKGDPIINEVELSGYKKYFLGYV